MRKHLLALALTVLTAGGAAANSLTEIYAQTLDLGDYRGVAYYTREPDGLKVVATLATAGEGATPMRFVATLADVQRMTISTPGGGGIEASIDLIRTGDKLTVDTKGLNLSE